MRLFEPEEMVGRFWHRLVGDTRTYTRYREAAVPFEAVRRRIGVIFRALGGSGAVRIVAAKPIECGHRLRLRQRLGLGRERIDRAVLDSGTLRLPSVIDVFPGRADNEALYEWLAAWCANAVAPPPATADPLQADILRLRTALATTQVTLRRWPGLAGLHDRLRGAALAARPTRYLPSCEATIEAMIRTLLGAPSLHGPEAALLAATDGGLERAFSFRAPAGYQTYLPVPIWGDILPYSAGAPPEDGGEDGGQSIHVDSLSRRAMRRSTDQSARGDPLLLHRFETIFSLAEMVNVNRSVEDDDEESARQAADDLPELTIGAQRKRPSTRLKLDLDLAPPQAEDGRLLAEFCYPEWDWKRQAYRRDYCHVIAPTAPEVGEDWAPDEHMQRRIRQVRNQFEALRPKRQLMYREADGFDVDLSALVRDVADRRAGGAGTERVFVDARPTSRDLSIAVLLDASLSTDAWLQEQRVLDVEKSALLALTHGLSACGDEHALFTFTSRRRTAVSVCTIKDFNEPLGPKVVRRIQAIKPGQYTRIGAAVRHVTARLKQRPHRHRLLVVITDGKPNDIDQYEGRYGIEDTRMAIREGRKAGLCVFGVTVDVHARQYFPYIFGRGAYAIFPNISRLPVALPAIYRQVTR
jgi:nitric oxide reductase NorD protein